MHPRNLVRRLLRRAWAAWPELAVVVAVGAAFEPTLIGSAHIPFDTEFFHFPLLRTVQEQLAGGSVPAWDQFSYGGMPLLANAQSAWLYPPHLALDGVLAVLGRPLTEHTLDVVEVLHVTVAGLGACAVARQWDLGRSGAALAGLFLTLNGEVVAQTQHLGMVETLAWLPWAVLCSDRMRDRGVSARRVAGLATFFALMILAGFLPLVLACAALILAGSLVHAPRARAVAGTLAGLALGGLLAAATLMPVAALLGVYPPLEPHGALPDTGLLTTIFPNAYGQWGASIAEYHGTELTNAYFYVGAASILLLPLAVANGRVALRESLLVLALLLASFGAVAMHVATALQSLPTVGILWRPEDIVYVGMLPVALLLARALQRAPSLRAVVSAAVFLAVVAALGFSVAGHHLHLLSSAPRRSLLALGLVGAAVAAAAVLARDASLAARRSSAVAAALGLAALAAGTDLASAVPHRFFVNAPGPATAADGVTTGDGSAVLAAVRAHLPPGARIEADIDSLPAQWSGFSALWHLSDTNGFQPQFSKYQLARVRATNASFEGRNRTFPTTPAVRSYLEELDVREVVVSAAHDSFAGAAGYTLVFADPGYHVYRVDAVESRAYALDPACVHAGVARGVDRCRIGPVVRAVPSGTNTRRFLISGPLTRPLLIATGELWYPGWHASAGGNVLSVQRVGALAAVAVPAGVGALEMSYRPPGLVLGVVVSSLAAIAVLLGLLVPDRRLQRIASGMPTLRGSPRRAAPNG